MLYPWDIGNFRAALTNWQGENVFSLHPFKRERVSLDGDPSSSLQIMEAASASDFCPPSRIFGTPEEQGCLSGLSPGIIQVPATCLITVPRSRIIGTAALMDEASHLYTPLLTTKDNLQSALARNATNAEGYVLRRETDETYAYYFSGSQTRRISGRALFLRNIEIGNYGSFLVRVLPQLLAAHKLVGLFDYYVVSDRAPYIRESLKLLDLPDLPIYEVSEVLGDTFDAVLIIAVPDNEGFMSPWVREAVMALTRRIAGSSAGVQHKLYVSRMLTRVRMPHYRPLANEPDVQAHFEARGFSPCYCETLSFAEQIKRFAHARQIAGPSGSGMLNSLFGLERADVLDIESFSVAVRQHAKVYASAGHNYAFSFGRFASGDDREPSLRKWVLATELLNASSAWLEGNLV